MNHSNWKGIGVLNIWKSGSKKKETKIEEDHERRKGATP